MYRLSQDEQEKAAQLYVAQEQLARDSLTYIHLSAQLDGHCAAVQIVITPFPLLEYPDHVGFCPRYQYEVCHKDVLTEDTDRIIARIVQSVIGTYFQLGAWDISTEDW